MKTYEIATVINDDGTVIVKMPNGNWTAGMKVKVTVDREANGEADDENESWSDFVKRTYGMFRDNPIERPEQPPMQDREWGA